MWRCLGSLFLLLGVVGADSSNDAEARQIIVGINIDPSNSAYGYPSADELRAINASYVRMEYHDSTVGPNPDPVQLSFYATAVARYAKAGVKTLMIIDYASYGEPKPSGTASDAVWRSYVAGFNKRAALVAIHFSSLPVPVHSFELWNEPDLHGSAAYDPFVPPAFYAQILGNFSHSLWLSDPDATVVVGGLASGDPAYMTKVAAFSGGVIRATAIGLHPYGQRPTPSWPSKSWGFGVLYELIERYWATTNKPIWVTEIGTNDMAVQGEFPYRAFQSINDHNGPAVSPVALWFCWSDGMVDPFGLVAKSGAKKPAYDSYTKFSSKPGPPPGQ